MLFNIVYSVFPSMQAKWIRFSERRVQERLSNTVCFEQFEITARLVESCNAETRNICETLLALLTLEWTSLSPNYEQRLVLQFFNSVNLSFWNEWRISSSVSSCSHNNCLYSVFSVPFRFVFDKRSLLVMADIYSMYINRTASGAKSIPISN